MQSAPEWTAQHIPDLSGRNVLVTGANSGIGFETARMLAGHGARVILACRSVARGRAALARLRAMVPVASAEVLELDLGDLATVSSGAHQMGSMPFDDLNWHHRRYRPWLAYAQSKLANLLFTFELQRRAAAGRLPLAALAVHPGYVATELQARGPRMRGATLTARLSTLANRMFAQDAAHGALPTVAAAALPEAQGAEYWGPDGRYVARGLPTRQPVSAAATDMTAAALLWERSERLTGVTFEALAPRAA